MFGILESNNGGWFSRADDAFDFSSVRHSSNNRSYGISSYELKQLQIEHITRDYFRNIYGVDPVGLGYKAPNWDWS